jgi:hypothetical protein
MGKALEAKALTFIGPDGAATCSFKCDTKSHFLVVPANYGMEPPVPPGESTGMNKELPAQCTEASLMGAGSESQEDLSPGNLESG